MPEPACIWETLLVQTCGKHRGRAEDCPTLGASDAPPVVVRQDGGDADPRWFDG